MVEKVVHGVIQTPPVDQSGNSVIFLSVMVCVMITKIYMAFQVVIIRLLRIIMIYLQYCLFTLFAAPDCPNPAAETPRPRIARHIMHIGVDGIDECFVDAPGGV